MSKRIKRKNLFSLELNNLKNISNIKSSQTAKNRSVNNRIVILPSKRIINSVIDYNWELTHPDNKCINKVHTRNIFISQSPSRLNKDKSTYKSFNGIEGFRISIKDRLLMYLQDKIKNTSRSKSINKQIYEGERIFYKTQIKSNNQSQNQKNNLNPKSFLGILRITKVILRDAKMISIL